jgi:hypothetical protein
MTSSRDQDDHHPLSRLVLLDPDAVALGLARVRASGLTTEVPNVWQITLGVLRMWHRVLFRSESIGTCTDFPMRPTWRARLMKVRPLRFPFLLAERAVHPLDFSGLRSSEDRVVRHLLGAHHDGAAFVYDFQLIASHPGALERVREEARRVVDSDDSRSRWLRDLVVYERYHENLLEAVEAFLAGRRICTPEEEHDPDVSFSGYLAWCARQPPTPAATWTGLLAGRFSVAEGALS